MFSSLYFDAPTAIRACFLTSDLFLKIRCLKDDIFTSERIDFKQRLRETAESSFYRESPFLMERQRVYILDEYFNGRSYANLIVNAFAELSKKFLYLSSGEMRFRSEAVPDWTECYSALISSIPLIAATLARELKSRNHGRSGMVRRIFGEPVIPIPYDLHFKDLISSGFSEIHMHYVNSSHPFHIWNWAIQNPVDWIEGCLRNEKQRKIWNYLLPGVDRSNMVRWLQYAPIIRSWLIYWLLDNKIKLLNKIAKSIEKDCVAFHASCSYNRELPLLGEMKRLGCHENDSPLVREGVLWTAALLKLRLEPSNFAARMLHLYQLISTIILRLSVHQFYFTGFDLFEDLAQSPLRDVAERTLHKENLIQIISSGKLTKLEARVAGKEDMDQFIDAKLSPVIEAYKALFNSDHDKNKGLEFGIICHFIKKPDQLRKRISKKDLKFLTTPRHVELRNSLITQLCVFLNARHHSPYGRYLVGIDGAGNEFKTPPEVFSAVFRELQYRMMLPEDDLEFIQGKRFLPKLHYTFHAGEDFFHLISGIRTIHESVIFLDLPKGSRLGHCLALGVEPEKWLKKNVSIRMPKLQRLDDLVWLLQFVDDQNLKTEMEADINRLSSELYDKSYSPHSLRRAWSWRYLGYTDFERSLASQIKLRRDLGQAGYLKKSGELCDGEVNKIVQTYHYDMANYEKGEQIIPVKHPAHSSQPIAAAILKAQEYVKQILIARQIAIETCPSSNLRISQMDSMDDHPIFQWHPLGNRNGSGLFPLIATDNPGFCQTSVPLEYCTIKQAAIRRAKAQNEDISERQLQDWLNSINMDTKTFSFLPLCQRIELQTSTTSNVKGKAEIT